MLPLTKKEVIELGEVLNTSNNEKIIATSAGLAVAIIDIFQVGALENFTRNMVLKQKIKEALYSINEVSIIDRELVFNLIRKYLELKDNLNKIDSILLTAIKPNPKALDIFGMGSIFSLDELRAIENNNIDYVKTIRLMKSLSKELIDEVSKSF